MPRYTQKIKDVPADLLDRLTGKERQQLRERLEEDSKEAQSNLRNAALNSLAERINLACEALELEETPLTRKQATEIHTALDSLKSLLRKRGYTRKDSLK